ncbi:MAG: alpha/beta hydrolase family protein [Planctomycetota bacterium]
MTLPISQSECAGAVTRRAMLRDSGCGLLAMGLAQWALTENVWAAAAEEAKVEPLNRFPRMVQEYFVAQVRKAEAAGLRAKNALKTKEDAERYVRSVREKISECFGPLPEKTPLNPRVTGVVERDAYTIEKVIFESRPEFLVTANLYIPKGREFPLPGVVGSCGHSTNGKCAGTYQSFAQGLARMGYVVLIFDPIGQGERLQYVDAKLRSRIGTGVREHLYAGNQQFLVGDFFGTWRAWDGIRALDYLLSREEVDPTHVGVTGNSGGGTMTTWLCGVEPRWTMAAPGCFVTTFRRNMENELPADTEQCPPKALALALDHDDFLAAQAPDPIVILAKERDFFDVRGSQEAYRRLKRLYGLLGTPESIGLFIGPTDHGYSQENREAMYRWFNRFSGVSDAQTEPSLTLEEDKTLWCTPNGQVSELGSRTVFSFTRAKSESLTKGRTKKSGEELVEAVTAALKLPEQKGMPQFRILRVIRRPGYPMPSFTTYAVSTEPGIDALVYLLGKQRLQSRPPRGRKRAVLYVSHHSSDEELRSEPLLKELIEAEADAAFYTCDVRGIGESRPDTCGTDMFLNPYGSDYFYAIHSLMLDRPYVGQRTFDVLRVIDWLKSFDHEEIHLCGKGWGAIPATLAAMLSDAVTQVTLKNALTSYCDVAESENYSWPLSAFLPGVLESFDLPDCYAALEAKQLRMIEPWGAEQS